MFKDVAYETYQADVAPEAARALNEPYLKRFVREHFPEDRSCSVLDLGCGTGALLKLLADRGYRNLEGVDCSPLQVRRRVFPRVRLSDGLNALLDSPGGSVDVVVAFDVIEHLGREDLLAWAGEVKRVLRAGGRWIVHVPNAAALFGNRVRYSDLTHELAFTRESIGQLARLAGFPEWAVFEDRPAVHGVLSGVRRAIWEAGRLPFLLLYAAETGERGNAILSQNMVAVFHRGPDGRAERDQ